MKRALAFSILLIFSLVAFAEYDFRNTFWGMTKEEVILSEDLLPVKDKEDILGYRYTLSGEMAEKLTDKYVVEEICYSFFDNMLVSVEQEIVPALGTLPDYDHEALYNELVLYFTEKYGEGNLIEWWASGAPKAGKRNNLLYLGELEVITIWQTEKTAILFGQARAKTLLGTQIKTSVFYIAKTPDTQHIVNEILEEAKKYL